MSEPGTRHAAVESTLSVYGASLPPRPPTLTDFLLARIAEDEERVTAWADGGALWPHEDHDPGECGECEHRREHRAADDRLAARMLAECAAKRRIVEVHAPDEVYCEACAFLELGGDVIWQRFPCPTLRALASVYADHPDYREEWKP